MRDEMSCLLYFDIRECQVCNSSYKLFACRSCFGNILLLKVTRGQLVYLFVIIFENVHSMSTL